MSRISGRKGRSLLVKQTHKTQQFYTTYRLTTESITYQQLHGSKKLKGQEVAFFSDRQRQISDRENNGCSLLQISILSQTSPKMGDFQPQIWYCWEKIPTRRKLSDRQKFTSTDACHHCHC